MTEEFLYYIWKFQLFNKKELKTTESETIEILSPGLINLDSGPDFFNGQVRIERTRWVGNIEIHINSSDWFKHNHQTDKNYDKVILHVVWEYDKPVYRSSGEQIPTIELNGLVKKHLLDNYLQLSNNELQIPCQNQIAQVDDFIIKSTLERMLIERLEVKSNRFSQVLNLCKNDWEAASYQFLAKYFGFKVNAIPFELLATSIHYSVIRKHAHNLFQLEALLFGQAGFLSNDFKGSYPLELKQEYQFLKNKYQLMPIDESLWKFMRMRPSNFPTIRIAQFASLLNKGAIFQKVVNSKDAFELKQLFNINASDYWNSHFRFDQPAVKSQSKKFGDKSIDLLLINMVLPMLFAYSKYKGLEELTDNVLKLYNELKPEKNKYIRIWEELNVKPENAGDSQALLQLKSNYCDLKKCLTCSIGNSIIKTKTDD